MADNSAVYDLEKRVRALEDRQKKDRATIDRQADQIAELQQRLFLAPAGTYQ